MRKWLYGLVAGIGFFLSSAYAAIVDGTVVVRGYQSYVTGEYYTNVNCFGLITCESVSEMEDMWVNIDIWTTQNEWQSIGYMQCGPVINPPSIFFQFPLIPLPANAYYDNASETYAFRITLISYGQIVGQYVTYAVPRISWGI